MRVNGNSPAIAPPTGLLRISTAGSVDDGKSTLIGRLLYETKSIFEDQLAEVERASHQHGADYVNLALLTDGLRAEREQGITIDVAYRYFATPARRFIVADTPGHVQYTRNMVTGASTADVAIVLVDASRGITEQSRRHLSIAALLRVPNVVVCVNKMDLIDFDQDQFAALQLELSSICELLTLADVTVIPIAALHGDNVVDGSARMPWYVGPTLLEYLERVSPFASHNLDGSRFPIQWVNRPLRAEHHDFRGYAGQVAGGVLRPGDVVLALPAGLVTRIRSIETFDGPLDAAYPPLSVTVTLEDDIDLSRGDMLCSLARMPNISQSIEAVLCWLMPTPLRVNGRYVIKHTTRTARAVIDSVHARLDMQTLGQDQSARTLALNDIGRVTIRTTAPLFFDASDQNRATGSFILIDEYSNETVAAGMIVGDSTPARWDGDGNGDSGVQEGLG